MRWIIALLTAAAALVAASNEVVSLDRFAAEKLDFPDGLAWTLPGMVTIATLVGALMWTLLSRGDLRQAGRLLNLVCAFISGAAVALDHASGAHDGWVIPAGIFGALVPALATWLTHLLARMTAEQALMPQSGQAARPSADAAPTDLPDAPAEPVTVIEHVTALTEPPPARVLTLTKRETDLEKVQRLLREGVGRPTLIRELGITDGMVKQLLKVTPEEITAERIADYQARAKERQRA